MAQHDQVIDNGPGRAVRLDMNAAIAALFSTSSGVIEPAVTVAGQMWFENADPDNPHIFVRNSANNGWLNISTDLSASEFVEVSGNYAVTLDNVTDFIQWNGGGTANLPAVSSVNSRYYVYLSAYFGNVVITPASPDVVDGQSTLTIPQGQAVLLRSNGTEWRTSGVPFNASKLSAQMAAATAVTALDALDTFLVRRATDGALLKISKADLITLTGVPVGSSIEYFGATTPAGYLEEDGAAYSRTVYAALFKALHTDFGFSAQTFTVTIATPGVFTKTGHGFTGGERVRLSTTGALPTGLNTTTDYFVIYVSANTFQLATTQANLEAGTAIATSGTQSGTHSFLQSLFGLGDGSTTFNVPDSRDTGSMTLGAGATLGVERPSQNKAHTHGITDPGHTHGVTAGVSGSGAAGLVRQSSGGSYATTANAAVKDFTDIVINSSGAAEGYPRHIKRKRAIKY